MSRRKRTLTVDDLRAGLAMTEAEFLALVLDLAKRRGWRSFHVRPARTVKGWRTAVQGDGVGFPDLILLRGDRLVVPELKARGGAVTPEQALWLQAFREVGAETYVWTPENFSEIQRVLE